MYSLRHALRSTAAVLALASLFLINGVPRVSATTGDTYVLPPAKHKVPSQLFPLYHGRYSTTMIAKESRIVYGECFISVNNWHDLYGAATFYGYDSQGYKTTWVNILYEFQLQPHGLMALTLYGWGTPPLGRMFLTRTNSGDLIGQIQLLDGKRYAISWHKDSNTV